MKIHRPSLHQSGLTLLELLVVLTILVVLSTVAITSTSGVADQARYEATQRTLENIRDAVIGPANLRDTDGTLLYTGFVADTGRLPKAVAEVVDGGTVLTLAELVQQPAGMAAYQVLPAITSNCTPADEADAEDPMPPAKVSADTIRLGVGWRGPYLRLPPGNFLPRDGWGAQLVTPVGLVPGFPNDSLLNGGGAVGAGDPIDQIISYGRDGAVGGVDAYDADQSIAFEATSYNSELTVQVEFRNATGVISPPTPSRNIFVRLFGPDPNSGNIRVKKSLVQATPGMASIVTMSFSFPEDGSGIPVTIGPCAVRAYFEDDANPLTDDPKSPPAYLMLRPGQNNRTLVITVP
ncbi:MAG: prepilin-type N-terminal cleavage/methylation domain-containing protein [Prosthecobacter sp.]|uniref:prepilin-type N-terminal cleavage/methylation domain-containing protein n=1 Tax=Prosthecobacter sp. TaxID=1965333 RepID=UPI003BAF5D4A